MKLWTIPSNYAGEAWPNYFVFLGQHRDSDCLSRSNFRSALKAIGGESDTVIVVRENHWAVGWVEWIAIHQDDEQAVALAEGIERGLSDYPVVDENDFSELEMDEAKEVWKNCYNPSERIAYIRKYRSQFEFRDLPDLLGCVRGHYFSGYASELLS